MKELESLLGVLGLLHVVECLAWVRSGALGLRRGAFGRWSVVPHALWSARDGGLVLANPLPPFGAAVSLDPWPLAISPDGIVGRALPWLGDGPPVLRRGSEPTFVAFDDFERVDANDRDLSFDGRCIGRACSAARAKEIAELVRQLAELPREGRERAIDEALERRVDPAPVREVLERHREGALFGRALGVLLMLALFVAFPAVGMALSLGEAWKVFGFAVLPLWVLALVRYHGRQRALLEGDGGWARAGRTGLMALVLPAAMTAEERLLRQLLAGVDPLAGAIAVGLEGDELAALGRRILADLRFPHPLPTESEPRATAVEEWFRQRLFRAAAQRLSASGVEVERLFDPPEVDADEAGYCPRCLATFRVDSGSCPDCGVALQPIGVVGRY